jgi:hypothetical protein
MGSRRYIEGASLRAYIARRAAEPLSIRRAPKPRKHRKPRRDGRAKSSSAKSVITVEDNITI